MKPTNPDWSLPKGEDQLVEKIVERATMRWRFLEDDVLGLTMDLIATHKYVCKLRLADMLEADMLDFAHDVHGIYANFNRETFALDGCFLPRFADTKQLVH